MGAASFLDTIRRLGVEIERHPETGLSTFGFAWNGMFIFDPSRSHCGRFEVDPVATYELQAQDAENLRQMNQMLERATQQALEAGCKYIQQKLGEQQGDFAAQNFSGDDAAAEVRAALARHLLARIEGAADDRPHEPIAPRANRPQG